MSEKAPAVGKEVTKALQKKVDDHNSKNPKYRATLGMLKACFRRGVGAYRTNPGSVRPSVRRSGGETRWAYARVNAFLYALRTGRFRGGKFDLDLLPRNHPLSSKKERPDLDINHKGRYDGINFKIPSSVKAQARTGLKWSLEYNRGGTNIGRKSARYLINNTTAGPRKVRHIAKYFARHEVDLQAPQNRRGGKGYPGAGIIAWKLWGGYPGWSWSRKLVRQMEAADKKAASAEELVLRKIKLENEDDDYRENRFKYPEFSKDYWNDYNNLLTKWDRVLTTTYSDLFGIQRREIFRYIKKYGMNAEALIGPYLDSTTKMWRADVYDLYLSMMTDFGFQEIEVLLPEDVKVDLNIDDKKKKTKRVIIAEGFLPGRAGETLYPIETMFRNSEAIEFVEQRLITIFPEMSKTTRTEVSRGLRKAFDEANKLGLLGQARDDYIANQVSSRLGKKQLSRASMIARTEGNALANRGKALAVKASGLITVKEWITMKDDRVRDAHIVMDGKEVGETANFSVSGYPMYLPGDSSQGAPMNLIANCRCTVAYHEKRKR